MTYWSGVDVAGLQSQITALQVDAQPLQTLTVAGASVSVLDITNLGDARAIRVVAHWVKSSAIDRRLFLAPNGIETDQLTDYTQGDGGGGAGDLSFTRLLLALGDRGTIAYSEASLAIETGKIRGLTLLGGCGDNVDQAQLRNIYGYGRWLDTSTVVTSVQVQCRSAIGLETDIADGTRITVLKLY